MKHECPRCKSTDHLTLGEDYWAKEDVTTYMKCLACNLLFWYSSYLKKINTNGKDAI